MKLYNIRPNVYINLEVVQRIVYDGNKICFFMPPSTQETIERDRDGEEVFEKAYKFVNDLCAKAKGE